MTMSAAQEHAAAVLRAQGPGAAMKYDHVQVRGDGPDGYYVMARLHADHTQWVRV